MDPLQLIVIILTISFFESMKEKIIAKRVATIPLVDFTEELEDEFTAFCCVQLAKARIQKDIDAVAIYVTDSLDFLAHQFMFKKLKRFKQMDDKVLWVRLVAQRYL